MPRFLLATICGFVVVLLGRQALGQSTTVVNITPSQTYQTMIGFGASLTQSGATAVAQNLTNAQQTTLMNSLFGNPSGAVGNQTLGIGLSFLRQPMGASDFRTADYTYDDSDTATTGYGTVAIANPLNTQTTIAIPALPGFSIGQDQATISGSGPNSGTASVLGLVQQAQHINPNLSIMGTPWTAPGWMKTGTAGNINAQAGVNQTLYGGTLVNESASTPVYETYAQYFVRYVQAYAAQGVHVGFITPQNEPYYNGGYAYPSMTLTTAQQVSLITAIGKDFASEVVNPAEPYNAVTNPLLSQWTKIDILDHNWSDAVDSTGDYPSANITALLGSPAGTASNSPNYVAPSSAAQYVSGVAFHGYGGSVSAQSVIQAAYPSMQILFTEQTASMDGALSVPAPTATGQSTPGGNPSSTADQTFSADLMYDMQNLVVGGTRDWASTITKFNLVLDQNGGPKIETVQFSNNGSPSDSGDDTGRGLVTVNNGVVTYNEEYYALGQIAKFVEPGAVRIGSDSSQSVAFMNPDALKTIAVIAYNDASTAETYQFVDGSSSFTYSIPADGVVTFSWSSLDPAAGVTVYETDAYTNQFLTEEQMINFITTPEPAVGLTLASVALLSLRRPSWRKARTSTVK